MTVELRRVAITGASGLIGAALARTLERQQIAVVRIGRGARSDIQWDVARGMLDATRLEGLDAVVNLAGENIGRRWSAARKREILESRTRGTSLLCRTLGGLARPPRALLSGSAMGVYGDRGDELLTEDSSSGTGFLAEVSRAWEDATRPASDAGIRVVHLRTGLVLSTDGGALGKMLTPFKLGVGGRLGSGSQWMSWIGMHDYARACAFLMQHEVAGPANLTAPHPVTNAEFTKVLASALHRPAFLPVPKTALRTIFGEMADQTLLASQRMVPARLLAAGFEFDEPTLGGALERELRG